MGSYKDLQIKAKELGMEKVIGISKEELIKYIEEHQSNDTTIKNKTSNEDAPIQNNVPNDEITSDDTSYKDIVDEETSNEDEYEEIEQDKNTIVQARGFKNYIHAKNYIASDDFKKLSTLDQEELKKWFENI